MIRLTENNLPAGSGRLLALDVLRGMTVAGMILVNNPGSWGAVYAPLRHASWNGLTPTDLVFPLFMFIMGVSTYLSLRKYDFACSGAAVRKILVRTAAIFAVGLAVGWFSRFCFSMQSLAEQGVPLWERVARSANNFDRIRVLGVLQRLALSYGAGALIAVTVRRRAIPWIAAGLLAAYGLILLSGNGFDLSPDNVVAVVDRAVLGEAHMYRGEGFPFDPEGLLSTVPSVAHVLIGFCIGRALVSEEELKLKILKILRWGALLMLAGWLLGYLCPVNKKVWSPSFVLLDLRRGRFGAGVADVDDRRAGTSSLESLFRGVRSQSVVSVCDGFRAVGRAAGGPRALRRRDDEPASGRVLARAETLAGRLPGLAGLSVASGRSGVADRTPFVPKKNMTSRYDTDCRQRLDEDRLVRRTGRPVGAEIRDRRNESLFSGSGGRSNARWSRSCFPGWTVGRSEAFFSTARVARSRSRPR